MQISPDADHRFLRQVSLATLCVGVALPLICGLVATALHKTPGVQYAFCAALFTACLVVAFVTGLWPRRSAAARVLVCGVALVLAVGAGAGAAFGLAVLLAAFVG